MTSIIKVDQIQDTGGNNIITSNGSGVLSALASGFGKMAQMVFDTKNDETSTASTSFVDTGLSLNITPTKTNSKIIVFMWGRIGAEDGSREIEHRILRDSTVVNSGRDLYDKVTSDTGGIYANSIHMFVIDEPSTTSQITYKFQTKTNNADNRSRLIADDATAVNPLAYLVAMEILA